MEVIESPHSGHAGSTEGGISFLGSLLAFFKSYPLGDYLSNIYKRLAPIWVLQIETFQ